MTCSKCHIDKPPSAFCLLKDSAHWCRACRNDYTRTWRRQNQVRVSENTRIVNRKRQARYQCTPKAKRARAIRERNRKALIRGVNGQLTGMDIENQFIKQDGLCAYCCKPLMKFQIDHVVPLKRNGSNTPDNIVLACAFCNQSKGAKLINEWKPNN